jgi:hypothetical protein
MYVLNLFSIISCRQTREDAEGCRDVTSGLQGAGLQLSLDPDRELERIHSLFAAHMNKLETLKGIRLILILFVMK